MKNLVTEEDRDDLYEVIPYCSVCVEETGDSSLGYCREHMDPLLNEIIRRQAASSVSILLAGMAGHFEMTGQTGTAAVLYKHANELREGLTDDE
jgi:hypothetical protein